ncbi:MAG: ABC transporter ATP-binding protein/permease [Lentisphaeraceae bacterium]|nr:ABC transporter ATP-binding protein/permease [Lentisphaeraceae bacterium]
MEEIKTSEALKNLLKFCLLTKKKLIFFVLLLVVLFNIIELGLPKILELYVKAFEGEKLTFLGFDVSFLATPNGKVFLLPLALGFIALARWIVTYLKVYHQGRLGQSVLMDIRRQIYDKVQNFSFDYHDKRHSGILISNLVEDVRFANMFFDQAIFLLMESGVFILTVYIFLFIHSPAAAAVSLVMLIIGYVLAVFVFRSSFHIYGKTKQLFAEKVALFSECMEGELVINAYGQQELQKSRYSDRVRALHNSNIKEIQWELLSSQLIIWSTQLGVPAMIFAYMWSQRQYGLPVNGGEIVLLFATQILIISKSRQLSRGTELLTRFAISARRLHEFFKISKSDDESGTEFPEKIDNIEFAGVTFSYGDREPVLNDLSFKFDRGHILGIAGSTGSGKSSLVQLMAGFYKPDCGMVCINKRSISEYSQLALRSNVAIVFQETFLFAGTVRENISFGAPDASLDDVKRAAELAHATEFINELEDGFEAEIGEKGVSLSGGQKQRLGIARALLHKPKLLILDSCTSALDTKTEKAILKSLRSLKDVNTVIISHRRAALESSDYLLVLDKGKLVEAGTPEDVCREGSHYLQIMEALDG